MSSRKLLPSIVTACLLTVGLEVGPNAASAGQIVMKPGESARNDVVEIKIKHRSRSPWFYLPIAPSYLAYDYPYYYSRGHYPTHIAPGYVYYGYRLRTAPNAPIGTGYASPVGR
jgi:predicted NodU family carbamoyl transferase